MIREIARLVEGTEKTDIGRSQPAFTAFDEIVAKAEKLAAISPNFVIKLQAQEAAWKAIPYLAKKGIRTNLTLVFSASQALQAMRMGAFYVSPFIGWKESNGEETRDVHRGCRDHARQLWIMRPRSSSPRCEPGAQIVDAAVAGADIVTAGLDVYKEAFDHPYTHEGIRRFTAFWDKTPYE